MQFYIALRRFPAALRKVEQILEIVPNDPDALVEKAAIAQAPPVQAAAALTNAHAVPRAPLPVVVVTPGSHPT